MPGTGIEPDKWELSGIDNARTEDRNSRLGTIRELIMPEHQFETYICTKNPKLDSYQFFSLKTPLK